MHIKWSNSYISHSFITFNIKSRKFYYCFRRLNFWKYYINIKIDSYLTIDSPIKNVPNGAPMHISYY